MTLAELYQDLHRHPELPLAEHRTAGIAADAVRRHGFAATTGVGGTGVVGVLRNGDGPTVLLRADMDALPIREQTGLPYASETPGVMHACGHDMHVTCLIGACAQLAARRSEWRGTVLAVFQPAEEIAAGAKAMLEDGLFERFGTPDVAFAQHVFPHPAGTLLYHPGAMLGMTDNLEVTLFGRGAHGSQPERSVDPVVLAASVVMRLQTIVSREIAPSDPAVVTVARMRAGEAENVIPDTASLTLNVRAFTPRVREQLLAAIERIVHAEAAASGVPRPPEIRTLSAFPALVNDSSATMALVKAFTARFDADRVRPIDPLIGSEDFGHFGVTAGVPSVFWGLGCADPSTVDPPGNHSPLFSPVIEPTVSTGVEALVAATLLWLGPNET